MANINSVITYNANLSPAQAQIKALTGQITGLTAAFNALDKSALKAQRSVAATFTANIGQIGGFTAQTIKATNAVETFGRQVAANKLTMREYFREAITGYTNQNSMLRRLAEQQVRYQQSVAVPIGGGQATILTPQSINAASSAAQLASQRFSIFNQLINGGATAMLNWGKNTQWAGRQLMVGFTLPLALFAGAMSKQFRELDKELTRFQKVYGSDLGNSVSESTQRMRDQVQQLAYDISSAYGIAAKETAALAADIAATGAEGEALMSSIQQTTRLAVLGEVDRQEAMKATLSLQSAFRMDTNELAESINFLNAVENQTSATLQDLSTAIPKVGPVVRSLGGDIKDLATLLVAMREGGIPAAEAANALKSGLASLINPTKQASLVAKQFGVDLVGIVEANRGQLMPTIYAMQDALNGLDSFSRSKIIEQIFGKYQFARITALFDNIGKVGSQTQSVVELASKSSAELAAVANGEIRTLTESTAVKFQRTLEQLKNSLMPIGQVLTDTLIPILQTVGEGIKTFSTFFSALPDSVKGLAKWGVALTALAGPVIMLVGLFGNLVANGLKFGMMLVRIGAKISGIKVERFQLLDENVMAAKLGVDNLTTAFTTQEVAMKRLVGVLSQYEQSLNRLAIREPALFVPGAVPMGRGVAPIKRQKGGPIPGYGGGDIVPAMLEPGEFVITKEATRNNRAFLETINSGKIPGMHSKGKDSASGSGQGSIGRAAKLHTVPPDELGKMYYGPGSKSMLGVLGYGGLTTTLHPQYINNTFDKLTGIPQWMKAGIPFNDRAASEMLKTLKEQRDLRGGRVGPEFTRSIQYLEKLIKTPGKAKYITLNGYAATTASAERMAGIIPDTDKAQKLRTQQLAAELNKRVGTTTSPGRIFSVINRLSMEYIDKAIADPKMRKLVWESTSGTSKSQFKDSLRERLPRFAQSGFLFRGIRVGRFQKGGVGTGDPALLEPGEFVVNSDASAKYAPILTAMNRGTVGKYQNGRDSVNMRPGYNPNDPKYSSPDKTPTGGQHQGHIFGAPVAPGIPAFGKNLQIGGQAIFWHQDFWKMVSAAENQLANVLAMSSGNRARFMESLSIVGPQFNASQQQIDRIMLAVTNGFMQHEDDVTLYQAALKNLGQRISTGAASVTGSMAGLIKQVESIKITGYSAAEAQAVERRLIAEYQRILSTPGQLAETARIAIAKQLQTVQQQMTATGIATTQMTASLASNIQASAARPFPGGVLVPGKGTAQGPQLAGAEQGLTKALQLRERLQLRLVASSERLEKLEAAEARIKADTSLSEQKRKVALDNLSRQYYEELRNKETLENASNRAEQNLIRAKERAATSYATVQPGGIGGGSGGRDTTFLGMPAIPPRSGPGSGRSGATGPDTAMKDPMARMMRGQGLMNVAFMGSMAIGSLGALGVASEDAASKLMLLSTALMALPMLGMMNPKGMATNFMGLTSAGKGLTGLGSRVAGPASAGMATSAVKGTSAVLPTFSAARGVGGLGGGLMMAGRGLSFLGGPIGIAAGLGITAAITGFMMYRNAAEEARERAIAAFNDPVKSAEYFGETIMNVSDILEKNRLSNISEDLNDVDKALREAVKQDYAPLIEQIKYLSAGAGAQALSVAYSNMIISGMSAENAKAAIEAIASEAGAVGGKAFTEALAQGFFKESLTIEQAVQNIVNQFTPAETKYGKTQQTIEERIRSDIAALEEEAQRLRADTAVEYTGQAPGGPPYAPIEPGGKEDYKRVEDQNSRIKARNDRLKEITDTINQLEDRLQDLLTINPEQISGIMDSLIMAYQQDPSAAVDGIKDLIDNINSLEDEGDRIDSLNRVTDYLREGYGQEWNLIGESINTTNEKLIAAQMLAAGISLEKAVDSAYRFDAALGQAVLTAKVLADEAGRAAIELQTSLTEDIVGDIEEERRILETEIKDIEDANSKLIRGYNRRKRESQEAFEIDQENRQNAIEGMQDEMDARRELFDEEMEQLDDRRDAIEKSSEAYIKSLQKNSEAESFYSQQRKTSLSALEKLASGDVFGFLQEREQMSADAQEFSYDQMISSIEDRKDLELEAIDETRKKKQDEQEEYENMMQDRIEAEQDLMEQQQEAHEAQMKHYDKQIKKAEREKDRKISVRQEEIAELNEMQEVASRDILEFQKKYAEEYKKYDQYANQLENLKILRVQEIYFRGGSSLFAAAQKAGIPAADVPDFIEKNASEFAFTMPGKRGGGGESVIPTAGTYYKNWMTEQAPDTQDLSQTIKDMTVSGDIIVNGNILGGSGTGPESWDPPDRRGATRDYEGTTYEYNWESNEWVPQAATGGYIKNGRVNLQDGGGAVRGPGGPKSDVIPAMLSNGEYVIQASSVRKYGTDLMHTINAGKYADGGIVKARDGAYISADRAETQANNNVYAGGWKPKPTYSGGTPTYSGGYTNSNSQYNSKIYNKNKSIINYGKVQNYDSNIVDPNSMDSTNSLLGSMWNSLLSGAAASLSITGLGGINSVSTLRPNSQNKLVMDESAQYRLPAQIAGITPQDYANIPESQRILEAALFTSSFIPGQGILASMGLSKAASLLGRSMTEKLSLFNEIRRLRHLSKKSNLDTALLPPENVIKGRGRDFGAGTYFAPSDNLSRAGDPEKLSMYKPKLTVSAWIRALKSKGFVNAEDPFFQPKTLLEKHLLTGKEINSPVIQSLIDQGYIGAKVPGSEYVSWLTGVPGSGWGLKKLSDGGLVPRPTGYANGGVVKARDGAYISADRAETQANNNVYAGGWKPKPQYSGGTPTYSGGYNSANTQSYSNIYGRKKNKSLINYNKVQNYDSNVIDPNSIGAANAFSSFVIDALRWMGAGVIDSLLPPSVRENNPLTNYVGGESYAKASELEKSINSIISITPLPQLGAMKLGAQAGFRAAKITPGASTGNLFSLNMGMNRSAVAAASPVKPTVAKGPLGDSVLLEWGRRYVDEDPLDNVFDKVVAGSQGGINPGGIVIGKDGVHRYVKGQHSSVSGPKSVYLEALIANAYDSLGMNVPKINLLNIGQNLRPFPGKPTVDMAPGSIIPADEFLQRAPWTNYTPDQLVISSTMLDNAKHVLGFFGERPGNGLTAAEDGMNRAMQSTLAKEGGIGKAVDTLFGLRDTHLMNYIIKEDASIPLGVPGRFTPYRIDFGSNTFQTPGGRPLAFDPSDPLKIVDPEQGRSFGFGSVTNSAYKQQVLKLEQMLGDTGGIDGLIDPIVAKFASQAPQHKLVNPDYLKFVLAERLKAMVKSVKGYKDGGLVQKFSDGGIVTRGKPGQPHTRSSEPYYSQNGWPYIADYGVPPLVRKKVPGSSFTLEMHKDVIPLFLALAAQYNKKIRRIDRRQSSGFGFRDNQTNHRSGTAMDLNVSEEGAQTDSTYMHDWWRGKKSAAAPWSSISSNPARTAVQIRDYFNQFGKIVEWYGSSKLGGDLNWGGGEISDWMHWQIDQNTKPNRTRILETIRRLGIDQNGNFSNEPLPPTPGPRSNKDTKAGPKEKGLPYRGLIGALGLLQSNVNGQTNNGNGQPDPSQPTGNVGFNNIPDGYTEADALRTLKFVQAGGWPTGVQRLAWSIAMRESGGRNIYDTGDYGIFQLNKPSYGSQPWWNDEKILNDPIYNSRMAYENVSSNGTNFSPWAMKLNKDGSYSWDWSYYNPKPSWADTTERRTAAFWNSWQYKASGGIMRLAGGGGTVSGPGGPRSDLIPAMLSNGEYVVKASSVSKYGKGFMDQLNSGQLNLGGGGFVPKFANGGMVGGGAMPSFNMPEMANTSVGMTNNNYGGNTSSNNSRTSVKVVINGASNKGANAIANQVISMINSANSRRDHSRSI